jgi:hypothetical protein
MKILNIRPAANLGGGRFRDVAIFDAEVADGLRLLALRLAVAPDGKLFVFAPQKSGQRFAQFTGDYAHRLAEAAWKANGGDVAHDQHAA